RIAAGLALAGALLVALTLVRFGGDPATKSLAVSASPPLRTLIDGVRVATDVDRDGHGTLLGENDCAPFDASINRLARDIPDNGIDENCDGRDFELGRVPTYRRGKRMPVPDGFRQPWNVLLITVDTVRYDHTNMGGYRERSGRNTTPRLAELAARSVSFSFANAPSAGTMASVPAILTSRFFHSGIALDEKVPRGSPPRLRPQNLLIAELFDKAGYETGAITTHEYFNDWGMEQGFDTYDNELGKKRDPYGVTSDRLTDRALAWIGPRSDKRWFLWLHYLDPHGRYVAHPGEVSFGTSEEDLYDGELAFTDKHIGRLLDELGRLPGAERTVIVLTSDHGDGFNEHGFINHGFALYRELLHVPLIVFVPNVEPRVVPGPVSPLDIMPTLIDLCGLEPPPGASFEGESLVPQLFYRQDARQRIVFAETNAPRPLRAAISDRYKLIYDIKQNVYELYDLTADPWEKTNLWPSRDPDGLATMKRYLDDWLERVYYARDPASNQAMFENKLGKYLLERAPEPRTRLDGARYDDGRIEVLGWDARPAQAEPGNKLEVTVYFRAVRRPSADFQVQVVARPAGRGAAARAAPSSSPLRHTGGGLLPTSRWRDGEHLREPVSLRVPSSWASAEGGTIELGLRLVGPEREALAPDGPAATGEPDALLLGTLPLAPAAAGEDKPAGGGPAGRRPAR
ncbi:MAG TPA: sulfatase-like hydrolase/transferase, partial [Kofleriaceae bacterium]|nr:sulfatase-like hydrolase/transferase [Kofleriaceae bacterium]